MARGREVSGRDDRDAREHLELDPRATERRPQPPPALLRVRAHVSGDVHSVGTHILSGSDRLRDDITAAEDELRAALAQLCVQILSASTRKVTRFGAPNAASTASSRTKSGTTCSARSTAVLSAGWSWTRRSRVNRTTFVFMDKG